jgi:7-keto-8-aminopelargonate synthetase-like enzyme
VIEPEPLQQIDRTWVYFRGRKLSYFAGCDYFRLGTHPEVLAALSTGLARFGWSVAASRLTTGNHILYQQIEKQLAAFFKADSALILASGYLTNLTVAQALAGQCSHVLIDAAAHPSLWDAAKAFDCPVLSFSHRSPQSLASAVNRCGAGTRLALLTDGMFSRDGSVAPLKAYDAVLPSDAFLLVDDAHAAGVLGHAGRGSLEEAKLVRGSIIRTITLSKAFGTFGGAILCSAGFRKRIISKSRAFIGSTPPPLPVVYATMRALKILRTNKALRNRLVQHTNSVRDGLKDRGLILPSTPGPIVAAQPKSPAAVPKIQRALLGDGIYPPLILYPGGPGSGYFRFVISSEHTPLQLQNLVNSLARTAHLLKPLE